MNIHIYIYIHIPVYIPVHMCIQFTWNHHICWILKTDQNDSQILIPLLLLTVALKWVKSLWTLSKVMVTFTHLTYSLGFVNPTLHHFFGTPKQDSTHANFLNKIICIRKYSYLYIYLEPSWPLFWRVDLPLLRAQILQNMGPHLGSK